MVGAPTLLVLVSFTAGVLTFSSRRYLVVVLWLLMAYCVLICPLVPDLFAKVAIVLLVTLILSLLLSLIVFLVTYFPVLTNVRWTGSKFWMSISLHLVVLLYNFFWRLSMELNIYTIFNRIDGSSDQLILARSDARVATDFVNSINSRNKELEAKHYALINLNDYELRKVGVFEDTTSIITPIAPVVVPFT